MLLQTNSYIVPKDKRAQHTRLVQRFRQTLTRLGCDHFEAYEQVGANWSPADTTGRFVQLMRFRDRKHQLAVQAAERSDATAQGLIKEFCELINFPYQQQQGLFAVGFYHSLLPSITPRHSQAAVEHPEAGNGEQAIQPEAMGEQAIGERAIGEEAIEPPAPAEEIAPYAHSGEEGLTFDDVPIEEDSKAAVGAHAEESREGDLDDLLDLDSEALLDEMEADENR
jgi:hypothetical protein